MQHTVLQKHQVKIYSTDPICRQCYFQALSQHLKFLLTSYSSCNLINWRWKKKKPSYSKHGVFKEKSSLAGSAQPTGIINHANNKIQGCFVFMSDEPDKIMFSRVLNNVVERLPSLIICTWKVEQRSYSNLLPDFTGTNSCIFTYLQISKNLSGTKITWLDKHSKTPPAQTERCF